MKLCEFLALVDDELTVYVDCVTVDSNDREVCTNYFSVQTDYGKVKMDTANMAYMNNDVTYIGKTKNNDLEVGIVAYCEEKTEQ